MKSSFRPFLRAIGFSLIAAHLSGAQASSVAPANTDPAIVPFKISVDDKVLLDLKERLTRARFADEIPDANWDYGTNLAYLQQLAAYWRDRYDWRTQEQRLNQFEQFKTTIDGVEIHFVHRRSKNPQAKPILLLNGWPSSMVEYLKVIGPLTDPAAFGGNAEDAFHVVIPSMPGFGFSGKPRERGFNPDRIAAMWAQLMARLGYTRYALHGTDWGSPISTRLALRDAAHVIGVHSVIRSAVPPATAPAPAIDGLVNEAHNKGYGELQSTKPQTLGYGLSDSPVGLASWILEKWHGWTDHAGNLEEVYSRDDLLTNIMIYWVTNSGASSARIYFESRHANGEFASNFNPPVTGTITVPRARILAAGEYGRRPNAAPGEPRAEASSAYARTTILPKGGHFPALENPDFVVKDLREFFRELP